MIQLYLVRNIRLNILLADLGKARGCSTNTSVINSVSDPLVKISVWRRHSLMVEDGAFSHKIDFIPNFWDILNLEGNPNCFIGSKVTVILVNRGDFT